MSTFITYITINSSDQFFHSYNPKLVLFSNIIFYRQHKQIVMIIHILNIRQIAVKNEKYSMFLESIRRLHSEKN
jgi:hypothetical protein